MRGDGRTTSELAYPGIDWKWDHHSIEVEWYDKVWPAVAPYVPEGCRVLEVGVGPGYIPSQLARFKACRAFGVDPLQSAISAAKVVAERAGVQIRLIRGVGQSLPFHEGAFDIVFSLGVIEHFPPKESRMMIAEHARVCRDSGLVIIGVPNLFNLVHTMVKLCQGRSYDYYPEHSYSRLTLTRWMRDAGLKLVACDGYATFWPIRLARSRVGRLLAYGWVRSGLEKYLERLESPFTRSWFGMLTVVIARKAPAEEIGQ